MVDEPLEQSQWQADSSGTPRHSDRIGCFQHGMGSALRGDKDERSVVQGGALLHVNCKELLAAFLALQSFVRDMQDVHVRISVDNTMTMYYINHMGGHTPLS